ncbi:hypothetical protein EA658_18645 [Pseudoxanthomonas winnipegensis]|jgi:hypothetical protein|uniref:Fido domain-containing protein n=1 Tax=Pseudoxanthomonas winnipegensis TaxID=2480810 RepID=A0ABY1WA37_9GAMM|nr:Fic family protein [Pseudoxanthomonas winnipegensis]TAA08694.1 hypothetical protein EA659_12630 [Pseudoxanthomonas winnipegensis]TAA17061.1 hypothetical protein EA658_18645 [Pseudoxanthomonas winnipegensis]TAH71950.1 hypothetical protein EA657_12595 [Pseudoxanthomonas winnipegensis]
MDVYARLLDFPKWSDIPEDVVAQGFNLEMAFLSAHPSAMEQVRSWLEGRPLLNNDFGVLEFRQISHELSRHVSAQKTEVHQDGRTLAEVHILSTANLPTVATVASEGICGFMRFCKELHLKSDAQSTGFRTEDVSTLPDKQGVRIVYPAPATVYEGMRTLAIGWLDLIQKNSGLAAAYIIVGLMTVHPFADGNGRVARILFNWMLNSRRDDLVYLPIHEPMVLSQGGYIIRVRQAQYHNNWRPLLDYFNMLARKFFGEDRIYRG